MRQHIVISRDNYVAGSQRRPEVGVFTQTHSTRKPIPWGKIDAGEHVWIKWSGGPIVARARVQGFRQVECCNAEQLRAMVTGFALARLDEYFATLAPSFFALVVYLDREEWLDELIVPTVRSRGNSWIVLDDDESASAWLAPTGGAAPVVTRTPRKKNGRGSRTIPASMRFEVFRRDDFTCVYCGRKAPDVVLHADHIVPWSAAGPTSLENLVAACSDCNLGKGARPLST